MYMMAFHLRFLHLAFIALFASSAFAAHGLAQFGKPGYPAGFPHFAYVNPAAPKGGTLVLSPVQQTGFDKFNPFSLKGIPAPGIGSLLFESLVVTSSDEVASAYGLLADDVKVADDQLSVSFHINPLARFSDGSPVLARDVKDSFETLISKLASPMYRSVYADVVKVVVLGERDVRFEFRQANAELPLIVGTMPVFSKKWGRQPDGSLSSFDKLGFEKPVSSGPYLIERFEPGRSITYRQNPDWWARDLNVRRGMFNFERVVFQIYKDDMAQLEAFKAGAFDVSFEFRAKNWARGYHGPRFRSGELIRREFPHHNGANLQGFVMNLRRPLFADVRVRKALSLAIDFEWMNRQLFFGQYTRLNSFYTDTELAAIGTPGSLPGADELKLLNPLRDQLPPEVFQPVQPPASTAPPASLRDNLRQARALLAEAGWVYRDGALRNEKGEPFVFEMLDNNVLTRIDIAYARNLERLGIKVIQRDTDNALFQKRLEEFDFDMTHYGFSASQSPGNELVDRFTSQAADTKGSENLIGLRSPAVDRLVQKVVQAKNRADLVAAVRALDRVLISGYYVIPHYYSSTHRVAYKRGLGMPETLPRHYTAQEWVLSTWWAKAE
ncbi:MAG: ABC transporter substrate-binding protein [Rhodocyclales bacterium GT-UBC]|nr:MAG: ABC transporter substrate-binding protein [Rhodocyclales bacterium GT-UBC]